MRVLLPIILLMLVVSCSPGDSGKPVINRVILVCLDTFRYDRATTEVTPEIMKFAKDTHFYTNCRASASWTLPSITSVFTGKYPSYAGVLVKSDPLAEKETTIAEILHAEGWTTIAFTANGVIGPDRHFDQGFDTFEHIPNALAGSLVDKTLGAVRENMDDKTFLFLHIMEPHRPYTPNARFIDGFRRGEGRFNRRFDRGRDLLDGELTLTEGEIEQLQGLYDAECGYADSEIGRLIDTLVDEELWDDTALIFFADHGEEFSEHNDWFHGNNLYEETVHVPLIVRFPDTEPALIEDITSLRIIGQLIFEGLGMDVPVDFIVDGTNYMEGISRGEERKGVISGDKWKLVIGMETGDVELFNLNNDPDEQFNLIEQEENKAEELMDELVSVFRATPDSGIGESELTPAMEEQLRALGYIN